MSLVPENSFNTQRFVDDFVSAMNTKDAEKLLKHYEQDAEIWDPSTPDPMRGHAAVRENLAKWSGAFSEMRFDVQDVIRAGDQVALRAIVHGRHTGELEIAPGERVPATNKPVKMPLGEFLTLSPQGKIRADHTYFDLSGMMEQLGLAPSRGGAQSPKRQDIRR